MTALAGDIGERNLYNPQALRDAADYIAAQWHGQGYAVATQAFEARGRRFFNLAVERRGSVRPERIILLGAHYDTAQGSPGANDNASGVAALLECSRFFAERKAAATLRFVAFPNEEPPFFFWGKMGSRIYADGARKRGDDIRLMLSLEMLGCYDDTPGSQAYPPCLGPLFRRFFPDRGNFIAFVSNFRSRHILRRLATAFRAHSDFPAEHLATFSWIPGVAWSDHLSFWRAGYPAVMLTDTAFYRYPYYHSGEDTPEKLDYARMARVVAGLCHAVSDLAADETG